MAKSTKTKSVKSAAKKTVMVYRVGKKLKQSLGEKARGVGGQYKCIYCDNWISNRQAKVHDDACGFVARSEINDQQKQPEQQRSWSRPEGDPPQNVRPIRPPRTTTKQRARSSGQGTTGNDRQNTNGGQDMAQGANDRQNTNGGQNTHPPAAAGGRGGRPPVSSEAHAVLVAFQAWKEADVRTVADLRAHLMSMEVVFIEIANGLQQYAQEKIIGRRLHPVIAMPIKLAADSVAGIGHHFTQAYINFEKTYAGRLEYERASIPKPNEKDPIFSQVD